MDVSQKMALSIELKPHEKLFINGAVIENGNRKCSLNVLNAAQILREKDILTEDKADTLCKRIYLSLQLIYMDPAEWQRYADVYKQTVQNVAVKAPELLPLLVELETEVSSGEFYKALRVAKRLVQQEAEYINHGQ